MKIKTFVLRYQKTQSCDNDDGFIFAVGSCVYLNYVANSKRAKRIAKCVLFSTFRMGFWDSTFEEMPCSSATPRLWSDPEILIVSNSCLFDNLLNVLCFITSWIIFEHFFRWWDFLRSMPTLCFFFHNLEKKQVFLCLVWELKRDERPVQVQHLLREAHLVAQPRRHTN